MVQRRHRSQFPARQSLPARRQPLRQRRLQRNTPVLPTPTVSSPTPTSTSTPRPTATVTPIPKEALGEIAPLDPSGLPNYTLTTDIELRGVPGQSDFTMSLLIIQAAPDHYYLRSTSGNSGLESWLVDGTTYLTQADGSVAALPADSDTALFSPSLLVQTVPRISSDTLAVNVGPEDVNGRQTTHKRVDGKDLLANANWLPGDGASNIEGQVDIWIDNETGIILRRESNVRWQNPDGSGGVLIERHDVTNISTTERVTAPG